MGRLKSNKKCIRITNNEIIIDRTVAFKFDKMISHNIYGLNYFKNMRQKLDMYDGLVEKLSELSRRTIQELNRLGKQQGCERIRVEQFKQQAQMAFKGIDIIAKDSKLIVFKFCHNSYRLICKETDIEPNTLYILGFDFNFSAYDHG